MGEETEAIISSPYVRALQSIAPLAQRLNVQVQVDARLSERVLSTGNLDNWLDCL